MLVFVEQATFVRRLGLTLGLIVLVGVLLVFLWRMADILLLTFVGILLAIFLSSLAGLLTKYTKLPRPVSLTLVTVLVFSILAGAGLLIGPRILEQSDDLVAGVTRALRGLVTTLSGSAQGRWLLEQTPLVSPDMSNVLPEDVLEPISEAEDEGNRSDAGTLPRTGDISAWLNFVAGVFGILPSVLGVLANTLFVVIIGIFLAASPKLYQRGFLRLFPEPQRTRAGEVLEVLGNTLQGWLLAQFFSMVGVGVIVGVGLWLLGIPFALTLAFLAFLLEFIPIVGPFLSAIPGILIAFTQGWTEALWVTLFYLVVQQLEGNLIMPLIQQRIVHLPPALALLAVLVMGTFFGFVGLLVATPLLAVVIVLVKMLYLKDTLGQKVEVAGQVKV